MDEQVRSKTFPRALSLLAGAWLAYSMPAYAEPKSPDNRKIDLYHLSGISEDAARGDILYCMNLARPALSMRSKYARSDQYGLLGALLNDWIGDAPTNRMRSAVMHKCMVAHGYQVYRADEAAWKRLLDLEGIVKIKDETVDAAGVNAMATFASRPLPADGSIHP